MNALTIRPFVVYFLTNTLSLLGTWVQKVGLGWLTWQITESTFWTSFVSIALMAPVGLIGPFVAVLAENWDTRQAMLISKCLMLLVSTVLFLLQLYDLNSLSSLVSGSLILGLLSALQGPSRLVFVSLMVPKPYLPSAIGLNSVSWNVCRIVGPSLAGFAIVFLGLDKTFGIVVLLYIPLIVNLLFLKLTMRERCHAPAGRFFVRLKEGGKVAVETPLIFTSLSIVFINSAFVRGVLEIQPAIVGQVLGGDSATLAMVTASAGLGALLAAGCLGYGRMSLGVIQRYLWPMMLGGVVGTACLYITDDLVRISAVFVITGFTATVTGIGAQTVIQVNVPEQYRARVMTWWSTLSHGSLALGGTVIGFLGDYITIRSAILLTMIPGLLLAVMVLAKCPLARWWTTPLNR
jgi:MFS family permease